MNNGVTGIPKYELLTAALRRVNSQLSAAECHGLISAALGYGGSAKSLANIFTEDGAALENDKEFASLISQLVDLTAAGYRDEDFNFQLLLPGDDVSLEERSQALADWCGGYLMGLVESGIKDFTSLPEDAAEVANDLVEISQLDTSQEGGSESDLMQLEEYVRVGVQIIYAELKKNTHEEISALEQEVKKP